MTAQPTMSIRTTSRQIWHLISPVHPLLPSVIGGIVLIQALILSQPYLFKRIIDLLTNFTPDKLPVLLTLAGSWFCLSVLISALINFWNQPQIFELLFILQRELPIRAHRKLVSLHFGYHESQETGRTMARVEKGCQRQVDLMWNMLFEFFPTAVQTIGTTMLMFLVDWQVALIFIPANPVFLWLTKRINQQVQPLRIEWHRDHETASAHLGDTLINIFTVQSFAQEPREITDQATIRQRMYQSARREWRTILKMDFQRDGVINVGRVMILLVSIYFMTRGRMSIGSVVMFVTLSETAYFALYRMSRMFDRAAEWSHSISRLCRLLDEPIQVVESPRAIAAPQFVGNIAFNHVTLNYGRGRNALENVSLDITAGQTVAFVGRSGSGKTTASRLFNRFYDPTSGSITIDGRPITDFTLSSLRQQIGVVSQDVQTMNRTVHDNIAYGRPDATMEEVMAAAQAANAHEFIARDLPQGYNTIVGERGFKLSGGQRQRLCIARAILTDPRILIFDEATSSLDTESEIIIHQALEQLRHGRTVIVIAHRLSTIRQADKIFVLRHGHLVEQGTHSHLLSLNGVYTRLYGIQHHGVIPAPVAPATIS